MCTSDAEEEGGRRGEREKGMEWGERGRVGGTCWVWISGSLAILEKVWPSRSPGHPSTPFPCNSFPSATMLPPERIHALMMGGFHTSTF